MVDLLPMGAVVPAAPHLGVERVEDVGVEVADLPLADERSNVLVHILAVARDGALTALVLVEVAVEQLIDGRRRARAASLFHLFDEPPTHLVGPLPRLRTGRDHLDQVVTALGDRAVPA
jgi:hypothetical protein